MHNAEVIRRARSALRYGRSASAVRALRALAQLVRPVVQAASTIFCASNIWLGVALGATLGLEPRYLLSATGSVLLAHGLARALRLPEAMVGDGSLSYNVLLAALAVVWMTREADIPATEFVALLLAVTVLTLVLSAALLHFVPRVAGLPPLSLAFTLVFGSLITLFPQWSAASVLAPLSFPALLPAFNEVLPSGLAMLLNGFLQSLGTILFLPHAFAGLLVAIALIAWSRLALVFAVTGYLTGMAVVSALTGLGVAFHGAAAGHNYLLAGLALGAVYFVPSRASLGLAALGGAGAALIAAVLQRLLHGSGWEYLPLPFILTMWVMLCALRLRVEAGPLAPAAFAAPNAETLWRSHARDAARFPAATETHLALPAAGVLTVTQGVDGKLSHRGAWRHALDFEARDAEGLPHPRGAGARIEDFYTYGLPVTAPEAAIVVRMVDDIADNPPGACNFARSWGNHVVLRLDSGAHVTLAHFRTKGIHVVAGQRVAAGQVLGECGSSGRSPVPHIHLQAQASAAPGAATLPFRIANYLRYENHDRQGAASSADVQAGPSMAQAVRWAAAGVPQAGERVAAAAADARVLGCLAHVAPGRSQFQVSRNPQRIESGADHTRRPRTANHRQHEMLACRLDDAGRHVFTSGTGRITAVAGVAAWHTLECAPGQSQLLWLIGLGLARAPYANAPGMFWEDRTDWAAPASGWTRRAAQQAAQLARDLAGPFTRWDGYRIVSRYVHDAGTPAGQVTIHSSVFTPDRLHPLDLPKEISVTLAPVRGVVAVHAVFARESVRWRLTSFEPA